MVVVKDAGKACLTFGEVLRFSHVSLRVVSVLVVVLMCTGSTAASRCDRAVADLSWANVAQMVFMRLAFVSPNVLLRMNQP